ncbi:MAG: multidrug efflux SMR transporter [Myxococcota bacterium]|nr:multidrug efflux SMR transporter [Myxococcota bacterium]
MSYLFLGGAIVFEVCGTLLLPTTENFTRLLPTVAMATCYLVAFYCLTYAVRTIPVAVTYAIWSGVGTSLIAIFGVIVYNQTLDWRSVLGLGLIVGGVALLSSHGGMEHAL